MKTTIITHIARHSTTVLPLADICNPYFIRHRKNALMVPLSCPPADYRTFFRALFAADNCGGAVIGAPHQQHTAERVHRLSRRAAAAAACNMVRQAVDGTLEGDTVAGEGLLRALRRRGFDAAGRTALIVGCGGTGAAAAQALAEAGARCLRFYDADDAPRAGKLLRHLQRYHLDVRMEAGHNHARDADLLVYAANGGVSDGLDWTKLQPQTWVAAMETGGTALLRAAAAQGCTVVAATATAAEQIPLYLRYFGLLADRRPFSFAQGGSGGTDLAGSRFYLPQRGAMETF